MLVGMSVFVSESKMSTTEEEEEEVDMEEIEVALYSQIHFGSGCQAGDSPNAFQEFPSQLVDHLTQRYPPTTKQCLLPFSVTKNVKKSSAQDKCIYVSSEAESPSATAVKALEDFLQLPKTDATCTEKNKKRLSKMEAAVQPVKSLRLRRAPAVIVKENSDTDTDYTESDDDKGGVGSSAMVHIISLYLISLYLISLSCASL